MKVKSGVFLAVCSFLSCADPSSAFTMAKNHRMATTLQASKEDQQLAVGEKAKTLGTAMLSASLLLGSVCTGTMASPQPASAFESKVVGQLKGSGLVFKDTLSIERFEDPKVKGVVLYISNFDRPVTEKLSKGNFFNDPSYASVACARTSDKVAIASNINKTPQGEEVFEESRSLLFKTLRVQRVYDEETKTAVYVSYNTRLDKNDDTNKSRFKSSLCAVNLEDYSAPAPSAAAAATAVTIAP